MSRNFRPALLALLFSLLFAWLPGNSIAIADEWKPIPPEDLKMTSLPEAPGAPAVILYRQVDHVDKVWAESRELNYVRIKVLNEEGRKYANVEIPFNKEYNEIGSVRARTVHSDGTVINFSGTVFEQTIVKAKGVNYLAKVFAMPDVQVGSIIEYQFLRTPVEKSGYGWMLYNSTWTLSMPLFTRYAKFSMDAYTSSQAEIRVHYFWPAGLPNGATPPDEKADGIIRMELRNVPALVEEDYMPPLSEVTPRVEFYYYVGRLESDPDKFWRERAKKEYGQVDGFIGRQAFLKRAVSETLGSSGPTEPNLRKLYDRVQKIRNLSYEFAKPEAQVKQQKLQEPRNVEELWNNGHGYAGELNWLFLGLARAAGFEAYPVAVSNRKVYFFNKARMSTRELSSTAVLVKLNGQDKFLDPGAYLAPFGLLPWEQTGVPAMILDKDGGQWLQTELGDGESSSIHHEGEFTLFPDGTLEGTVRVTYTGQEVFALRINQMLADEVARKKALEEEVRSSIPVGSEVDLTNKPDWTSSAPSLIAEFHVKVPGWASSTGKRLLLPLGLFSAEEKQTFEHADRHYTIYFEHPFGRVDDLKVSLPQGWQVLAAVKPETVDLKAAKYAISATADGPAINLHREMKIHFILMDQKFYPPLRSFFQGVKSKDEQQIVLIPGAGS